MKLMEAVQWEINRASERRVRIERVLVTQQAVRGSIAAMPRLDIGLHRAIIGRPVLDLLVHPDDLPFPEELRFTRMAGIPVEYE